MIQCVSKLSNKNKAIIVFNTNQLTEERLDNKLINSNTSNLQIYIYKFSNNRSPIWSQFKELIDRIYTAINIFSYSLIKTIKNDVPTRTFSKGQQYPFRFLRVDIMFYTIESSVKYFHDLEVHLYKRRNGRQFSRRVYSKFQWKCEQCTNRTMFEQVCHNKTVSLAFFQYLSHEAVVGYASCVILDL